MKQYFTGFFTAVCLTASVFLFMGSQNKNLGDIVAKSIRITGDGKLGETIIVGSDIITKSIYITGGEFGATMIVGGGVAVLNKDGKTDALLTSTEHGTGHLKTYNSKGEVTAYLGTNMENDGTIILRDRYGDTGWLKTGKK